MCRSDRVDWTYLKSRLKLILNNHKYQTNFIVLQLENLNIVSNMKQIDFPHIYGKNYLSKKMDLFTVCVALADIKSVSDTIFN
jgi:hypothetical protein